MAKFVIDPAGGLSQSRTPGTMVKLAGRTAILPNEDVPIVMQRLTVGQINAIPKDRFSVSLIEVPTRMAISGSGHKGRGGMAMRGMQRMKDLSRKGGGITGYVRKPTNEIKVEADGTKQYYAMVTLAKQMVENAGDLYYINRKLRRNSDVAIASSGIFLTPIDEGKLSDCIKKIILDVFGDGDKGKICDREIKLVEFCLMMHYYFLRIKILKNTSRQPFCDYLEKYVFADESRFTAKTFNNYANNDNYKKVEPIFTDEERLHINFKTHPTPDGTLKDFFHEVGYYFYNSSYFGELRDMRTNIENFKI